MVHKKSGTLGNNLYMTTHMNAVRHMHCFNFRNNYVERFHPGWKLKAQDKKQREMFVLSCPGIINDEYHDYVNADSDDDGGACDNTMV